MCYYSTEMVYTREKTEMLIARRIQIPCRMLFLYNIKVDLKNMVKRVYCQDCKSDAKEMIGPNICNSNFRMKECSVLLLLYKNIVIGIGSIDEG